MRGDAFPARAWRELRRRRIPTVFVGYPGVAWFVIESVPTILVNLGAESGAAETVASALTILAVAAFPLVLLLTWMFQVVPDAEAPPPFDAPRPRRRLVMGLSVVLVSSGCVTLAALLWPPVGQASVRPWWEARSMDEAGLALLPPQVLLGGDDVQRIADCLVHRVRDRLAGLPGLVVRGPAETEWITGLHVPADSLAALLAVGTLIVSTAEATGSQLRVTMRLVDGRSGRQGEAISVVGEIPDADGTFEKMTDALELDLREALGRAREGWIVEPPPRSQDAQQALQQGVDEMALFRRHLADRDVDAALASLARADSAFALAAARDPTWPDPLVRRSRVARERFVLLLTNDRDRAILSLAASVRHAEAALAVAPDHAEALHLRGLATHQLASADTARARSRERMLADAEADLRRAQATHRNRAAVRYDLARVKRDQGLLPEALAIARDAFDHDAYLTVSDRLLTDLFDLSFELSRDEEASDWCREGARRFPDHWGFSMCRLTLMGWGGLPPDTAAALALMAHALSVYPAPFRGALRPQLETLVAAVRAQAGDTEGARAILELTPLAAPPAVKVTAAGVWLLLGEEDAALAQLRAYVAQVPAQARGLGRQRILAPLLEADAFRALVSR